MVNKQQDNVEAVRKFLYNGYVEMCIIHAATTALRRCRQERSLLRARLRLFVNKVQLPF